MIRIYQISTFVLLLLIIALCVQQCGSSKAIENYQYQLGAKSDSIKSYKDENGKMIEMQRLISLENFKQVEGLEKELKEMKIKSASLYIKYKSIFRVDTLKHNFIDTLPCAEFIEPFVLDSGYVKFNGEITKRHLNIYNLEIPNEMVIAVGEHKKPWYKFQPNTISVFVKNSNEHVKGKQLEPYVFTPKKPFYNQLWFKCALIGSGLIGGVLLAK